MLKKKKKVFFLSSRLRVAFLVVFYFWQERVVFGGTRLLDRAFSRNRKSDRVCSFLGYRETEIGSAIETAIASASVSASAIHACA